MRHLPGSLANLIKGFLPDTDAQKGDFPYHFLTKANWDYEGPIPDKSYYDLGYRIKDEAALKEFNEYYDSWQGRTDWNLQQQMLDYARNDVNCLALIMRRYDEITSGITGFSPWLKITGPGVTHAHILNCAKLDLEVECPEMLELKKHDLLAYNAKMTELAKTRGFAKLDPSAHYFAQAALRGGKTDAKWVIYELTEEEIAQGYRIHYDDIKSSYPAQQIGKLHPIGVEQKIVYDPRFKPCDNCAYKMNLEDLPCDCSEDKPEPFNFARHNPLTVKFVDQQPTKEEILEQCKTKGGIIYARVDPPKDLFHPVLHHFDKKSLKCLAPCYEFEGHFPLNEFKVALELGYEIKKVYRIDWYRMGNLWKKPVFDLYMLKDMSSGPRPSPEEFEERAELYEELFEMGVEYQQYWDKPGWGKNPAVKQVAKTLVNSGWGKHAENPNKEQTIVMDKRTGDYENFCVNVQRESFDVRSAVDVNQDILLSQYRRNPHTVKPDLSKGYMPAAVYVAAEGRLALGEELRKLGKRVLYHDTDSIKYVCPPGAYQIPLGKILGCWEREDFDLENDGIRGSIGMGPKTYADRTVCNGPALKGLKDRVVHKDFNVILYKDDPLGFTPKGGRLLTEEERLEYGISDLNIGIVPNYIDQVKCKGLRTMYAHREMLNYDIMKAHVTAENPEPISVPQLNFKTRANSSIISYEMTKKICFDKEKLKGTLCNEIIYPPGYDIEGAGPTKRF